MGEPRAGPLAGLRVLDLTRGIAGAVGGMLLADCGAEVLRIEPPGGDPLWDELPGYAVWHRGKEIVEIDLGEERARGAVLARLPAVDLLLESLAPGALERLGLSYETVAHAAPGLVYVSISAHGQTGPDRDRPGFDALVQARLGIMDFQGGGGAPVPCTQPWPSFGAGLLAVIGALAGLRHRDRCGRGSWVETSLVDGALAQWTMFVLDAERTSPSLTGPARLSESAPTMAIYRCGDGGFLHLHSGARGGLGRLLQAAGLDPARFVGPATGRHFRGDPEGAARLRVALDETFATRSRDAWVETLSRADVAAAPCLAPGEALSHPQVAAMDMVVETSDALLGPIVQAGIPMRFAEAPGEVRGAARRRGAAASPEAALRHSGWPTAEELAAGGRGARAAAPRPSMPARDARGAPEVAGDRDLADAAPDVAAPLAGLRVLDFGMFAAGPYAATLLAELGADVIKIEPPTGDTMRPAERNFLGVQRGKRGLAIDLKAPSAAAVIERLVRRADVVVHNLRPGVAERLGIGYERLAALRPGLVYCHSTAYGSRGPLAARPGFDQMYQAFCGMEVLQGGAGGVPRQVAGAPLDYGNAFLSAAAILMALHRRQRTGRGEHVECPQLAAGLFALSDVFATTSGVESRPELDAAATGYGPGYRLYATRDAWVFVCCPDEAAREALGDAFGPDPESFAAALSAAEAVASLAAAGVPAEVVRAFAGDRLLDDAGLAASGRVVEAVHPRLGRLRQLGGFIRFAGVSPRSRRAAPEVGEHTREVLAEVGYAEEEIERLRAEGVIAWPDAIGLRGGDTGALDSRPDRD